MHLQISAFTNIPEIALEPGEAKAVADAAAEVAKHYDIKADPKTVAWINLAIVAGGVYGGRVAIYRLRKAMEADKAKPRQANGQMPVGQAGFIGDNVRIN